MVSALGIPLVRILVILAMSWFFKVALPKKWRDAITPWSFAGLMVHANVVPFIGGAAHFFLLMFYFVNMAILLDGCNVNLFKKNKVMSAFLVFWGYLTISSLWCDGPYFAVTWWLGSLLELVLAGYFAGIWAMRTPDGMRRLLTPLAVVGVLSLYFYFKYGFVSQLDATGRGMLDRSLLDEDKGTNVNQIGLSLAPIVSSMMILALSKMPNDPWHKIAKGAAFVALLLTSYLLIRTGSRNACLVFLPCGYFAWKSLHFTGRKAKTIFFLGCAALLLVIIVKTFILSDATQLRGFQLMEQGGKFDVYYATSGRWFEFELYLSNMSGLEWFFGAGPEYYVSEMGPHVGGCLSVYVTLLRFVGVFGMLLLMIYFMVQVSQGQKKGLYGQIAILFFLTWAITGLAEGQGIRRGHAVRLVQGVALALCSNLNFGRREEQWYMMPPPMMGFSR